MEYSQEDYILEDDIIGKDVSLGVEGTKSNGHGEEKDDKINMVETVRNLKKDI
jgi:hypothetical protein